MSILVTGGAGFIGYHLCKRLIQTSENIVTLDNINSYYDPRLKYGRLKDLGFDQNEIEYNKVVASNLTTNLHFIQLSLDDLEGLKELFAKYKFKYVINLAAQAGVRYSLENPHVYASSNLVGFVNLLECCKQHKILHLLYASTSSVYGLNKKTPFSENDSTEHPITLYAATKKANELLAHSFSHLFALPTTGMRFFTVYGPWGRPDMALFKFADLITSGQPIEVYNHGEMIRDFTYVEDVITAIEKLMSNIPVANANWDGINHFTSSSSAPYRIVNIGNGRPEKLIDYIRELERALGTDAKKRYLDIQPGDVPLTNADTTQLFELINFKPRISIREGVEKFVEWYIDVYKKMN